MAHILSKHPTPFDRFKEIVWQHDGVLIDFKPCEKIEHVYKARFAFKDETIAARANAMITLETGMRVHRIWTEKDRSRRAHLKAGKNV